MAKSTGGYIEGITSQPGDTVRLTGSDWVGQGTGIPIKGAIVVLTTVADAGSGEWYFQWEDDHPEDWYCILDPKNPAFDRYGAEHVTLLSQGETVFTAEQVKAMGGKEALEQIAKLAKGGEVRTTSSTGGEKGVKPEAFDLIPWDAMDEVARVYNFGASKYAAHNWRKGYEWSKSFAAACRHMFAFWRGEDRDPESGTLHVANAVFHMLALITFALDREQYGKFDNRYKRD